MKTLSELEKNKIISLVSLTLMVILGFFVRDLDTGFLGEEKIYEIMGGQNRTPIILNISRFFAFIGSPEFLVPTIAISVITLIFLKKWKLVLGLTLSTLGVFIINTIAKLFYQRQRPIDFMLMEEFSSSYPSGHAMTNTCLYLFLAYYLSRFIKPKYKTFFYVVAIIMSIIMCFSRVHLGVHYLSDVIGGFLGGYGFFIITVLAVEKLNSTYKKTN